MTGLLSCPVLYKSACDLEAGPELAGSRRSAWPVARGPWRELAAAASSPCARLRLPAAAGGGKLRVALESAEGTKERTTLARGGLLQVRLTFPI